MSLAVSFNAFFPNDPATNAHVDVQDDHFQVVREIGAASAILLKNVAGALPLRKPKSLAIIGTSLSPRVLLCRALTSDVGQVTTLARPRAARTAMGTAQATTARSRWAGAPARPTSRT